MNAVETSAPVLAGRGIRKTFKRATGELVVALDDVSFEMQQGTLTALVGPDGAGKTTLIRLAAGLLKVDSGELGVLGIDVGAHPQLVQDRIGYMPQKFGLYEDLSVLENLNLYADLHGIKRADRPDRYARLMQMTALGKFKDRRAGQLSGGMKQKLGLACTLVSSPDMLLLDEPTVGVDPLSRRELWEIILQLVHEQKLTVLLSTSYLDEAERCGHVVVMHQGKVLTYGTPEHVSALAEGRTFMATPDSNQSFRALQAELVADPEVLDVVPEAGRVRVVRKISEKRGQDARAAKALLVPVSARFEDGFMTVLRQKTGEQFSPAAMQLGHALDRKTTAAAVQVRDLVKQFGKFTAVDKVSFEVKPGEIFGLLGPNGAGKTTTFRMLCGLLTATGGILRVAGIDVRTARDEARQKLGYVAQKFSLYGQLSVMENLEFFASAYGLRWPRKKERIDWALKQFELAPFARLASGLLPGGFKQRLAMAAALLHEPEILFLDEPTSGADPLARREFWQRINALAEQGVTIIVTTHFMEEAEYCDRIVIMDAGQVLAQGTPAEVRRRARPQPGRQATMEDAFITVVEDARGIKAGV